MADPSIYFMTPGFLSRRVNKAIRGVQVFDIHLVRQLVELGHEVTVPVESSWKGQLEPFWEGAMPRIVWTPALRKPLPASISAVLLNGARKHGALILGNSARSILPAARWMFRRGRCARGVLIAHKHVKPAYASALAPLTFTVAAVNRQIASEFEPAMPGRVTTYYGIPNADQFHPSEQARDPAKPIDFVLLGRLDNPWKGAAAAIDAFRALPHDLRARSRLHLVSFADPPAADDPGIVHHPWRHAAEIPELLRGMDVILVPSPSHETFSQALVQGMLTGLPAITSGWPCLAEKLDTGGGIVCRTVAEYTAAMARLATDAPLRRSMGDIARHTALERYVWDTARFVDQFLRGPMHCG